MSKRTATVQLTSNNVDQYGDEEEEAGKFTMATKEEMDQRVIKKAKRSGRSLNQEGTGLSGTAGIFAGLKKSMTSSSSMATTAAAAVPSSSLAPISFSITSSSTTTTGVIPLPNMTSSLPLPSEAYLQQLASLNRSVSGWITRHVDKNPYVDLTPIFRDYERHLGDIDKKHNVMSGEGGEGGDPPMESSGSEPTEASLQEQTEAPLELSRETPRGMQSELPQETKDSSEGAEEGNGKDNGFGTTSTPLSETQDTLSPPLELTSSAPDTEPEGVIYSTRTKLFYMKEAEYVELGTGTVRVQNASNGSVQLLLRNDTTLRNILLNVKVTGDMPISSFKKSVLVVCSAPNPPLSIAEGPVTYLLRVKTAGVAEELLRVIKESTSNKD